MTTLLELKTKYEEEQAARQRAYDKEVVAEEAQRAAEVVALFPDVCSYLAGREGVDIAELVQYGRLEGDWYSSGQLSYVTLYLELPDHEQVYVKIYNPDNLTEDERRLEWRAGPDSYNHYRQLAPALIEAAKNYQKRLEYEQQEAHEAEEYQIEQALKAHEARRTENEKQQLFDQIAGNPAALLLLKLFVQIQRDTDSFDSQIASLESAQEAAAYWHEEALENAHRKIRATQEAADDANRRADSLQYENYDLEDELKKAERQCR